MKITLPSLKSTLIWFGIVIVLAFVINWGISKYISKNAAQRLEEEKRKQAQMQQQKQQQQIQQIQQIPNLVYLDISKEDYMRTPQPYHIVIQLFTDIVPKTCTNFAVLCETKRYVDSPFHRVIKDFMVQGGDFVNGNGTGSYSIYDGKPFEDENFVIPHNQAGLLSMANSGPNSNGCQFFILTNPAPHLNGKHVVFGKVIEGMQYVTEMENEITDAQDQPLRKWVIVDCGVETTQKKADEQDYSLTANQNQQQNQVPEQQQQNQIPEQLRSKMLCTGMPTPSQIASWNQESAMSSSSSSNQHSPPSQMLGGSSQFQMQQQNQHQQTQEPEPFAGFV